MSADQDESSVYSDLIGFLKSDRSDLRLAATEATMAVKDLDGMSKLVRHGVVAPLTRLSSHPGVVGLNALTALVRLSSHGPSAAQCIEDLMDAGASKRMTEISLSRPDKESESEEVWKKRVNFSLALVVNMTRTERGAVEFVGRTLPDEAVLSSLAGGEKLEVESKPTMELLLARFLSDQYIEDVPKEEDDNDHEQSMDNLHYDPYQHFASVLMNGTQVEAGRKFVLRIHHKDDKNSLPTSVLQAILPQLRSPNPIRRRSIAGTIKNCCLETDFAWWLLEEVKIVKHLLYPLAGPEELDVEEKRGLDPDLWLEGPDKARETDDLTRLFLVESILLLCASGRKSRERLRLQRVYVILKWTDMVEEREDVSERINECVQYLRRDEEGTAEGSSDATVEQATKGQAMLALPAPSASNEVGSSQDYDDVD